jgi:hypothetical protein
VISGNSNNPHPSRYWSDWTRDCAPWLYKTLVLLVIVGFTIFFILNPAALGVFLPVLLFATEVVAGRGLGG